MPVVSSGGDPRGLEAVEPFVERVYGFAWRRTGRREDAEDLAQEILLALCQSLARGYEVRDMGAWVWSIARNTWTRWLRTQRAEDGRSLDGPQALTVHGWLPAEPDDDVVERLARREAVRRLMGVLARTASEYRRVVVLHYLEGRTIAEIAAMTALAEGTVKRRLHTARNRLRERMMHMDAVRRADPVRLTVHTNGRGEPAQYLRRLIARSIAVAAFEAPRTIEELADGLGVPAAYIEDEVRHLVSREVMAAVGAGRYQTDFVIATRAVQNEIHRSLETLAARWAPSVRDAFQRLESDVRAAGFHGADRPWAELLWTLIPLTFYTAQERYCERVGIGSYREAPFRKDGGQWYAVGYEGYDPAERPPFEWASGNNFEHAAWDGWTAVFHNVWLGGLGLRAGMLTAPDIRLLVSLVAADGEGRLPAGDRPPAADGSRAADLVMRGFLERTAGPDGSVRLRPTLPVFSRDQEGLVLEALAPVLEIHDAMIGEAYAFSRSAMADRVPRRLHGQLEPFLGGFVDDVKGYLLGQFVAAGVLSVPADPRTSTLGMSITYRRKAAAQ